MRFCQDHWDRLRAAIDERGLSHLIAPDGKTAMMQMADQLKRAEAGDEPHTPVNYDPLMSAHWAIVNNLGDAARQHGGPGAALYILTGDICPLCFANEQHQQGCQDEGCTFTYDDWIDYAANDQAEYVKTLRADR